MIEIFTGTPGAGKSLHLARFLYSKIKYGYHVIANFAFDSDSILRKSKCNGRFTYRANNDLTPDWLEKYSRWYFKSRPFKEEEIILVIDEAQLIFNCREWSKKGREQWISFFTQHRKLGYHVILVAQFERMLDSQVRALLEYQTIHRKCSNSGIMGKVISALFGGRLFVAVRVWYPMRTHVGSEFFLSVKKYYSLYDSYHKFDGGLDLPDNWEPVSSASSIADSSVPPSGISRAEAVAGCCSKCDKLSACRAGDKFLSCDTYTDYLKSAFSTEQKV